MEGLFGGVVPIWTLLTLLISTKANYCQSENIKQGKGPEKRNPLEISYISKPSVSAIDVVCCTYLTSTFQITCPVFDGKALKNSFIASKAEGTCESTVKYSHGQGSIRLVRRISWKQPGFDSFNFTCFCGIKLQAANNSKNEVSVKAINQKCERNIKVFRKKINAEKNIHISCCITGQPPPQITWYKDEFALNITHGSTVINNVQYQQKGARLLISRTDVHGSGRYQCLARNSAGHERGGTYQIIFYESKTNKSSNGSEQHILVTSTPMTGGNIFRNSDETVDNKEEEERNEKQYERGKISSTVIGLLVSSFTVCVLGCFILLAYRQKKRMSTDRVAERSTPATSLFGRRASLPVVLSGDQNRKSKKTQLIDYTIDEKLVDIDDEPSTNFKESKHCSLVSSPNLFLSYLPTTSVFHPFPQSVTNTSSIDVAAEIHLVHPNVLTPLVSTMPCSSSTEDIRKIFKESYTFCPIDHMTGTDPSVDDTEVFAANMPSPDLSTGTNTSELLDKLITVPPNADERYFASALIDHNGGEVILAGTGIKLVIPEGAIGEGKTEVVHLALLGNPEYAPKELKNEDTALTPVVMCGPHGLRFKKHVMLLIPHCVAVTDELQENFRVLCSETVPEIAPDWKEIFNNKDEPNKEVFCNMGDQQFCLFLHHFSWYTIRGEGRARNFSIQAYHTTLHEPNEEFRVRIYFVPILRDSSVGQKKVDEVEEKLQGTLSDGKKIKIFYKTGGDIKVEAIEISEGWQLINQNIQTQDYKVLSICGVESPNQTFRFQHVTQRPERISCTFRVSQANCKFDIPVDISMSLHFESEKKRAFQNHNNSYIASDRRASTPSTSGYGPSGESTAVAFIPTKLRKDLIQLLDRSIIGIKNWKDLAEHLGYDLQFIQWLDRPKHILSPTEKLLMEWENDVNKSPEDALAILQQKLCEIDRTDIADKIRVRKETTV